jgi:hypothetical protein
MGKKLVCLLVGLGLVGSLIGYGFASATDDVTISVTPIVSEAILVDPNSYAYGNLDLGISSVSASVIVTSNTGSVGVNLDMTVNDDGTDWTIATSTGVVDRFVLWAMTNATRPEVTDFKSGHKFSANVGEYGNLFQLNGTTQQALGPSGTASGTANLWFRLDMPTSVTKNDAQSIIVRIRATAQ